MFVMLCITVCPFLFCNHLEEEKKAGCFVLIVLVQGGVLTTCMGAMGWSAVYDFGIS